MVHCTGYRLVVHCWADLQSVHEFRCYDNINRTRNVSECLYSLYAWLTLSGWWGSRGLPDSLNFWTPDTKIAGAAPVFLGGPVPRRFSSSTFFEAVPFGDKWHRILRAGPSSCHPMNSVKALEETTQTAPFRVTSTPLPICGSDLRSPVRIPVKSAQIS